MNNLISDIEDLANKMRRDRLELSLQSQQLQRGVILEM